MYQRALQRFERAFDEERPEICNCLNIIGLVYVRQGKVVEAEKMYQRALQGLENFFRCRAYIIT